MEKNLFEIGTREGYLFDFKGQINLYDVWKLPLKALDTIFKGLNAQLKETQEESLLETKTKENEELDNKIQIIKYIVQVKQQEETERLQAKENREKKQKIMELIAKKQDQSLENMSIEELRQLL